MAAILRLFALSSLCIFVISLSSVSSPALAHSPAARDLLRGHDSMIKRKRGVKAKRCQAKMTAPSSAAQDGDKKTTPTTTSSSHKKSPTPPPAPPAPAPVVQPADKKVGIGWANSDNSQIQFWAQPKVGYLYTWSPFCPNEAKDNGIQCCPMLWGWKDVGDFQSQATPGAYTCAMGMNEPDFPGQSDIAPSDAVNMWWTYMEPLHNDGYLLISPACTNGASGLTWMQSFMGGCGGCHVDVIALHYYGTESSDFISYVTNFYNAFKKPIWVTEVACENFGGGAQCSMAQTRQFLDDITGWMDSTPWVHQYFWFGVLDDMSGVNPDNQLIIPSSGQPNSLGWDYLT